MSKFHFIILAGLALLALPVYLADRNLMAPTSGPLPVDMRGVLITVYLIWFGIEAVVSTGLLLAFRDARPVWIHLLSAPVAVLLTIAGVVAFGAFGDYRAGKAREAHLEARAGYADAIRLVQWQLEPAVGTPERALLSLDFWFSGRFAAHIEGRSIDDMQTYTGELKPQVQVEAGEHLDAVLPLTHYRDLPAENVSITLYLFKDETGSAPEDIRMTYRSGLTAREDDGSRFHAPLPPEGMRMPE